MSPSELKYHVEQRGDNAHFFSRKTMQFFGDSMRNYGVRTAEVRTAYDAQGNYVGNAGGCVVQCWELYRKRPVKHGLQSSHYFAKDDYRTVSPMSETHPEKPQ